MAKLLSNLIADLDILDVHGKLERPINGIAYDSRDCKPGFLFFALPGIHTDGTKYIGEAIKNGATAVVHEGALTSYPADITTLRVPDSRWAMSAISSAFYENPSSSLCVIGVTGTEGKSTTVYAIYQLLNLAGFKAGFFSTVMSDTGKGAKPNPQHQTTPEAPAVHEMLATMRDNGLRYAIVEASSHGLSLRTARLAHVAFDIGLVTNVTHEHLEFHGTWEQYRSDKGNLFRHLGEKSFQKQLGGATCTPQGIVCADDPSARYFIDQAAVPCQTYSSKGNAADLVAYDIKSDLKGSDFFVEGPIDSGRTKMRARINLPGTFNVQNVLGAILAASAATGLKWHVFLPYLPELKPVRGRMQRIIAGQPFDIIIDYAHTPSSFKEILPPLRKTTEGRIICVFGSGGERDRAKRPQQGRIAADYCDIVILSDEDPRGEDPLTLLEEIAAGCPELPRGDRLYLIPDRPMGIRKAFSLARAGDLVLLLGKGHENSIIYADKTIPYDEETTALSILEEMGFCKKGNAR